MYPDPPGERLRYRSGLLPKRLPGQASLEPGAPCFAMQFFGGLDLSPFDFTRLALTSAAVSWTAVRLLDGAARKWGMVSRSRRDRFGAGHVPLTGGLGLCAGALVALLLTRPAIPLAPPLLALGLFVVGLLDDRFAFRPAPKFALQAGVALAGSLALAPSPAMAGLVLLTVLFAVNASNYLDNMDALLPGVALVQALALMQVGITPGVGATLLVWALPGALLHSMPPARAYLGDSGSHLVGALLAIDAVGLLFHADGGLRVRLLLPLALLFAVPIADVATVTLSRLRRGRPLFRGGTDHLSHRLVRFGYPVPRAVLLLVLASGVCGIASLILARS